ncbi:putative signal transduction protein [Alkalidesulfovibrio alkalitolerans DSM 16529]|uniref:Putative signal transduction protein n=2 Tax=Alkalidesulfovibrio alkalitolerans TaxID=293256 RepID=S7TGL6_9BACT|nr:putative signal transduction protein [Alkalidesulfovibrio alkalitolerans DSM 16529]
MTATTESIAKAVPICAARFVANDIDHPVGEALHSLAVARLARILDSGGASAWSMPRGERPPITEPNPRIDPVDLLQRDIRLPSLPGVLTELQDTAARPTSSVEDLASVVARDPSLAALILRLVNSAFYGCPQRIETISRAVAVLGMRQLNMLATGACVARLFGEMPDETIDLVDFWRHSVGVGLAARALALRLGLSEPERHFTAGLLHDIGRLALCVAAPDRARRVHELCAKGMAIGDAEAACGLDHAVFGGMLLRKWNLPFPLALAVLRHHTPTREDAGVGAALTHVADIMVTTLYPAANGEFVIPRLDIAALTRLGITPDDVMTASAELDEWLAATMETFFGHAA